MSDPCAPHPGPTPPAGTGPSAAACDACAERRRLEADLLALEEESRRLSDDLANAQEQVVELAERYVALSRLHAAPDAAHALEVVQEIVVNLVGSEELVVLRLGPDGLEPLLAFGVGAERLRRLITAPGSVGRTAASGVLHLAGQRPPLAGEEDLSAAIPLRVAGRPAGAIAIFHLLGHKQALGPSDHAVFELLTEHAGMTLGLRSDQAGGTGPRP
jgi:hypothetical protein